MSNIVEYFGKSRNGCIVGQDEIYSVSHFSYNEKGLLLKEVARRKSVKPNGTEKKQGKSVFRRKYTYY